MDILIVAPRFPWPLEKGDKLRLFHFIRVLSERHNVHLFAICHQQPAPSHLATLNTFCKSITCHHIPEWRIPFNLLYGLFAGHPLSVAYFTERQGLRKLRSLFQQIKPDVVLGQLARTALYSRSLPGPRIIDIMDAFSRIAKQQSKHAPWWQRAFFKFEANRLKRFEHNIIHISEYQLFISQRDRDHIDPGHQWPAIVIPNGIDLEYFKKKPSAKAKADIVFIGNLGYFPNVQAARILIDQVMPEVWKTRPATRLLLAGARPDASLCRRLDNRITLMPNPEDIREAYSQGNIFVAALFQGAGLQNKILEAMAMELPVVTTPLVAAGMHPEAMESLIICEDLPAIVHAIDFLLDQPEECMQRAKRGREYVLKNHEWSHCVSILENSILKTIQCK